MKLLFAFFIYFWSHFVLFYFSRIKHEIHLKCMHTAFPRPKCLSRSHQTATRHSGEAFFAASTRTDTVFRFFRFHWRNICSPFPTDENLGNLLTPNIVREYERIPENGCLCLIEQLQLILFPFEIDLITIYLWNKCPSIVNKSVNIVGCRKPPARALKSDECWARVGVNKERTQFYIFIKSSLRK